MEYKKLIKAIGFNESMVEDLQKTLIFTRDNLSFLRGIDYEGLTFSIIRNNINIVETLSKTEVLNLLKNNTKNGGVNWKDFTYQSNSVDDKTTYYTIRVKFNVVDMEYSAYTITNRNEKTYYIKEFMDLLNINTKSEFVDFITNYTLSYLEHLHNDNTFILFDNPDTLQIFEREFILNCKHTFAEIYGIAINLNTGKIYKNISNAFLFKYDDTIYDFASVTRLRSEFSHNQTNILEQYFSCLDDLKCIQNFKSNTLSIADYNNSTNFTFGSIMDFCNNNADKNLKFDLSDDKIRNRFMKLLDLLLLSVYLPTNLLIDDTITEFIFNNTYNNTYDNTYDNTYNNPYNNPIVAEIKTCEHCGDYLLNINYSNYIETYDRYVCNECMNNLYKECEDCGEIIHEDDAYYIEDGDYYVCEDCRENNYYSCSDCGTLIYEDNVYYFDDDEWNEEPYCERCYNESARSHDNGRIYSYHEFRNWRTFRTQQDNKSFKYINKNIEPILKELFVGFELEIEPKNYYSDKSLALDTINPTGGENDNFIPCVAMHDGSLCDDGIEIVSQPMSYHYIMDNQEKIKNTFRILTDNANFISHNSSNCGLHFHFTAPKNSNDRKLLLNRLWSIFDTYTDEIQKLSRRKSNFRWCHWLKDEVYTNFHYDKLKDLAFNDTQALDLISKDDTRYLAINDTNSNTIEFRIFRGTLNFDTFMSDFQFVYNCYTQALDFNKSITSINWSSLTRGKFIKNYVVTKDILTDKKISNNKSVYKQLSVIEKNIDDVIIEIKNNMSTLTTEENFIITYRNNNISVYNADMTYNKILDYVKDYQDYLQYTTNTNLIHKLNNILDYFKNIMDYLKRYFEKYILELENTINYSVLIENLNDMEIYL